MDGVFFGYMSKSKLSAGLGEDIRGKGARGTSI